MKKVIKENGLYSADGVAGLQSTLRNRHIHHRHDMGHRREGKIFGLIMVMMAKKLGEETM